MPPRRGTVLLVLPGGLTRQSGGNVYDRAVIERLDALGWTVALAEGVKDIPGADVIIQDSLALPLGPADTDAPVVALVHQLPSSAAERPEWVQPERRALQAATRVVTVSRWLGEAAGELTDAPVSVIPPGRDRAWAEAGPHPEAATVLCVANAFPGKGLPEAVEAFEAARLEDGRLVLAGDPDRDPGEAARLRDRLRNSSATVDVAGFLEPAKLSERYANARLLLTASRFEGWPIAVAEAMAGGLPVAGFDVPGLRELVRDGVDGLLVPAGDLDALGAAVRRVFRDRRLGAEMGSAARGRALRWPSWQETASRFAALIEDVAGQETGAV
ncbi:MAG: glycosyltransferase family 4 protein [Actinomycetota bacterium]